MCIRDRLRSIARKIGKTDYVSLSKAIYAAESYRFTETMHKENSSVESLLSKGHKYDFKSNVLSKLEDVYKRQKQVSLRAADGRGPIVATADGECAPKEQITVQVQPLAGRILLPKPAFERFAAQRTAQSADRT